MKRTLFLSFLYLLVCGWTFQQPTELFWEGFILVESPLKQKLKIQLSVDEANKRASINVPEQALNELRVKMITYSKDSVVFSSPYLKAVYSGRQQGDSIIGHWKQLGNSYPLNFYRSSKPVRQRPQNPTKPYPYQEKQVIYYNKDISIRFGGTLTYPQKGFQCPAVILISGSGQQDRDETLFHHKPFWIIADYLTRKGIVVLRIDDRGVGQTTGDAAKATSEDFSKDVLEGVSYLKQCPEVNPKRIGLIGHSEGGMIAPLAARNNPDIAFIISLAGVGVTGEELAMSQWEYEMKKALNDSISHSFNQLKELWHSIYKIAAEPIEENVAKEKMFSRMQEWRANQDSLTSVTAGFEYTKDCRWEQNTKFEKRLLLPWMRYMLAYNPETVLKDVHCPMLILNGEKDRQVFCDLNINGFKAIAKKLQKKNMEFIQYPSLNHLFQHCQTGDVNEYIEIEETFAPEVLKYISLWIRTFPTH